MLQEAFQVVGLLRGGGVALGLQQGWDLWRAMRSEQGRNISNLEPLAQHK
jgi:hypothetical protein